MLTGNNGILAQAQKAKNETEKVAANEANILGNYEDYINNTTGDVPQVDDSNPGTLEGSGTEEDPYTINSIEDLVSFADSVTNANTYEGEYVKLNQSLDFKSDKSYVDPNIENHYGYTGKLKEVLTTGEGFKPIGTTILETVDTTDKSKSFYGYFDGNGKIIYNTYMNKDTSDSEEREFFGFFGLDLYGEVKNLGLVNIDYSVYSNEKSASISGIAHRSKGTLNNCYVTGNITVTQNGNASIYCSGLINNNSGTIENCYNVAKINGILNGVQNMDYACIAGGITANNEAETAEVRNCYNLGNINVEQDYRNRSLCGRNCRSTKFRNNRKLL